MTPVADRAVVSLALECASRLRGKAAVMDQLGGKIEYLPQTMEELLDSAERIIEWHDKICVKRAERDAVRRNAPQRVELHPSFAGA